MTGLLSERDHLPGVSAETFRAVFRRHAAGVAVIATGGPCPRGFTATSLVSLSASPPLLSFNVSHGSSCWPAVEQADHLALHLLAADQVALARTFATPGIDRFAAVSGWQRGPLDLPVLPGVMAWLGVRVQARVPAGDSSVVVAEVLHAEHAEARPLLFHAGRYAGLAAQLDDMTSVTPVLPS